MVMTETSLETDVADGEYAGSPYVGMIRETDDVLAALIASATTFPVKPPAEWFDNPRLNTPTPLTIDANGRVSGHIATWRQSHIGLAGGIRPPKSRSNYAFFATGALETAEGKMLNVGQITLSGGHAPLEASVADAVAHYDNTNTAVMDVAVGEDNIGVWVAGAVRPDLDEIRLRTLRASSVSGDWRPINGGLELVAVCAVNVPGFPIPRARVAGGQPVALVAAGTEDLAYIALLDRAGIDIARGVELGMRGVDERMQRLEDALVSSALSQSSRVDAAIRKARRITAAATIEAEPELDTRLSELRTRVRPQPAEETDAAPITADELRARVHRDAAPAEVKISAEQLREIVHGKAVESSDEDDVAVDVDEVETDDWGGDLMPLEASLSDCEAAVLRRRVRGGVTAAGISTKARENAAAKGYALKDGSYPIRNVADLKKAIKAYGRAKDKAAAMNHIMKRARALKATDLIPAEWKKKM